MEMFHYETICSCRIFNYSFTQLCNTIWGRKYEVFNFRGIPNYPKLAWVRLFYKALNSKHTIFDRIHACFQKLHTPIVQYLDFCINMRIYFYRPFLDSQCSTFKLHNEREFVILNTLILYYNMISLFSNLVTNLAHRNQGKYQ